MSPVFVSFLDLDGDTVYVNTQAPIDGVEPYEGTLPTGVTDASSILCDGRTIIVRGTVAATVQALGQALQGPVLLPNFPLGPIAYASLGTDAVSVAGTLYYSEGFNPTNRLVSTIAVMNGTVVGTDKVIHFLYDGAGNRLAFTSLAGTTSAGADTFQQIAVVTPIILPAGRYYVGFQVNGNTAAHQTMAASSYPNSTGSLAGVFGTIPTTIVPPTTFTANVGPFALLG